MAVIARWQFSSSDAGAHPHNGLTLIELSIVLVVIGLIVGGVLLGRNLIKAAEVRAQITQIEKYNSAVNTFRGKFNALPGDMGLSLASQFGFTVGTNCNGAIGRRNNDGLIQGPTAAYPIAQSGGEVMLFWQDLASSAAGSLIPVTLASASCNSIGNATGTYLSQIFPQAALGNSFYIYVYSYSGANWYGLSGISQLASNIVYGTSTIDVIRSYSIDTKIDDGLPTSGSVQTMYINASQTTLSYAPNTTTSGGDATSCYDTTTGTYSITQNNGNGGNCALSFRFQ